MFVQRHRTKAKFVVGEHKWIFSSRLLNVARWRGTTPLEETRSVDNVADRRVAVLHPRDAFGSLSVSGLTRTRAPTARRRPSSTTEEPADRQRPHVDDERATGQERRQLHAVVQRPGLAFHSAATTRSRSINDFILNVAELVRGIRPPAARPTGSGGRTSSACSCRTIGRSRDA